MLLFPKDSLTKHYKDLGLDDLTTDLLVMDDYGFFDDDYAPARAVCKKKPSPPVRPQASREYQEWRERHISTLKRLISSYQPIVEWLTTEEDKYVSASEKECILSEYDRCVKELAELEKGQ